MCYMLVCKEQTYYTWLFCISVCVRVGAYRRDSFGRKICWEDDTCLVATRILCTQSINPCQVSAWTRGCTSSTERFESDKVHIYLTIPDILIVLPETKVGAHCRHGQWGWPNKRFVWIQWHTWPSLMSYFTSPPVSRDAFRVWSRMHGHPQKRGLIPKLKNITNHTQTKLSKQLRCQSQNDIWPKLLHITRYKLRTAFSFAKVNYIF